MIFFSKDPKDYTLRKVGSKSPEHKAFYEYPSVFKFPIQKNVSFQKADGSKIDYIEQDLHVLFPAYHLGQKQLWELETKGAKRIPLFQSPLKGTETMSEKPLNGLEPDLDTATEIVLDTYCLTETGTAAKQ